MQSKSKVKGIIEAKKNKENLAKIKDTGYSTKLNNKGGVIWTPSLEKHLIHQKKYDKTLPADSTRFHDEKFRKTPAKVPEVYARHDERFHQPQNHEGQRNKDLHVQEHEVDVNHHNLFGKKRLTNSKRPHGVYHG